MTLTLRLPATGGRLEDYTLLASPVAPLAEAGASLEEVREAVDLSDQQALFAQGDDWIANRFNAWWVQPFVGVAFQEATGEPIIQGQ